MTGTGIQHVSKISLLFILYTLYFILLQISLHFAPMSSQLENFPLPEPKPERRSSIGHHRHYLSAVALRWSIMHMEWVAAKRNYFATDSSMERSEIMREYTDRFYIRKPRSNHPGCSVRVLRPAAEIKLNERTLDQINAPWERSVPVLSAHYTQDENNTIVYVGPLLFNTSPNFY